MAATTAHLVAEFIDLADRVKSLEEESDKLKEKKAEIEAELLERFAKEGYQRLGARGHTVYVHRQLWAKATDSPAQTVEALKASEWAYLVEEKFNTQQLSSAVRELVKAEEKVTSIPINVDDVPKLLPIELQPHVSVAEKMSLRVRKG